MDGWKTESMVNRGQIMTDKICGAGQSNHDGYYLWQFLKIHAWIKRRIYGSGGEIISL